MKTGNESQCDFFLNNALRCWGFCLFLQCQRTPRTCCLCLETEKLGCAAVFADAVATRNADSVPFNACVKLTFHTLCILWPSVKMSEPDSSSAFSGSVENGTFLQLFPTSLSTSVDPSSGHLSNVYIYVSIFLSLLAFLLLLLIIALQRLKNIISSSSSYPEYPSDAGSSFTNLEVCSISSQRSTFSNLSSWME